METSGDEISRILFELGEDRKEYFNAVAPPIVQTSNFAFRNVSDLRAAFKDESKTFIYGRGINPTVEILRKKLAALDGAEDALVFNSGAAAIFAAVLASVRSGDHIVSVSAPYTWASRMFDVILPRFGVKTTYVDGRDPANFERAARPETKLFYLESPNSWTFAMQDLSAVAAIARARGILTICDNSYATSLHQRPIEHGIDLTLQSATKYIGGHSDVIAGVLSGSSERIGRIFASEFMNMGSGIQPFNAWLLIRGLRTMPIRMERAEKTALEVCAWLKRHPRVESVLYPFDPDFPQHALAKSQMTGAGGLMSFVLRAGSASEIERFCESLKKILMAVSWGGYESLILPRCAALAEAFDAKRPDHRMLRLYCGLEDAGSLIADLDQALSAAPQG
jgi:cystathionine beta-lyase